MQKPYETWKGQPLWSLYRPFPPRSYPKASLSFDRYTLLSSYPKAIRQAVVSYTCGLIALDKPTFAHMQLYTSLSAEELTEMQERLDIQGFADQMCAHLPAGGHLKLDDVVIAKENNSRTVHVYRVHSGSDKRILDGHLYVALFYVTPSGQEVLLTLILWTHEGRTKIQVAQAAIERAQQKGLRPQTVAFDNAYLEPTFCRWLRQRGMHWYSRVRCNQLFYFGNRWLSSKQWGQLQAAESWHYYSREQVYAKGVEAANQDFGVIKIVAVKWERTAPAKGYCFYITSDRQATVRQVIGRYRRRWGIEVCFRDCQQGLGLGTYRFTDYERIVSHVLLVAMAYNCLQWLGRTADLPVGQLKRLAQGRPAKPRRTRDSVHPLTKIAS